MSRVAIITARGGSKRIPKKNIKDFCGKPILAYSIEAAIKSNLFDEVMVSTDSQEIAKIAKDYGAQIPFMRSRETSNDYAITMDVLKECIAKYSEIGKEFDTVCCIYPTAPFITSQKLKEAIEIFDLKDADCVSPVVQFSFPPQRSFVIENDKLVYKWPENYAKRSQDLEKMYHDVGQFYVYKTEAIKNKSIHEMSNYPIIVPESQVQDIDTMEDWKLAEIKFRLMMEE